MKSRFSFLASVSVMAMVSLGCAQRAKPAVPPVANLPIPPEERPDLDPYTPIYVEGCYLMAPANPTSDVISAVFAPNGFLKLEQLDPVSQEALRVRLDSIAALKRQKIDVSAVQGICYPTEAKGPKTPHFRPE